MYADILLPGREAMEPLGCPSSPRIPQNLKVGAPPPEHDTITERSTAIQPHSHQSSLGSQVGHQEAPAVPTRPGCRLGQPAGPAAFCQTSLLPTRPAPDPTGWLSYNSCEFWTWPPPDAKVFTLVFQKNLYEEMDKRINLELRGRQPSKVSCCAG